MNRRRLYQLTAAISTQRLSCNYTSGELTQFDGRARGNLTVCLLCANQVTVGKLAYRCCADY